MMELDRNRTVLYLAQWLQNRRYPVANAYD
jgi:hypothetical protein